MGAFSVIYNIPLFYQVVLNLSSAKAGLRLIPSSIGASVGSLGYGMLMAKTVAHPEISLTSRAGIIGLEYQLMHSKPWEQDCWRHSTRPPPPGNSISTLFLPE